MRGAADEWIQSLIGDSDQVRPPERNAEEFIQLLEAMSGPAGAEENREVVFAPTEISSEVDLGEIAPFDHGSSR